MSDGAVYGPAIADGEWWRLVTGGFLHASIIHIGFNMYLLWILGGALERYAGAGALPGDLLLARCSGARSGRCSAQPDSPTIGASGGVFGLMAALYLLERQRGVALLGGSVGMLLLLNLGITFVLPGHLDRRPHRRHRRRRGGRLRPVRLRPRAPRLRAHRRPGLDGASAR